MTATSFQTVQMFLIKNRKRIERFFLAIEFVILLVWLWGSFQIQSSGRFSFELYQLGRQFGQVAVVLYMGTLLPGIFQRLRFQQRWTAAATPFRRHIGIMTFLSAFVHYSFVVMLPFVLVGVVPVISPFVLFGFLSLLTLFPLWLTSNDPAQRFLGKKWKVLHRLTYLAMLLIFGHVALQSSKWMWPMMVVIGLELLSWFVFYRRKRVSKTRAQTVQLNTESSTQTVNEQREEASNAEA